MTKNEQEFPMKIAFEYSLKAVAAVVIWVMIEHGLGFNTTNHEVGQYTRMASAFLLILFVYLAVRERKAQLLGTISFGGAFRTGLLTVAFYALLSATWFHVYASWINPDFYPSLKSFKLAQVTQSGATQQVIESAMKEIEMSYSGSLVSYLLLMVFTFIMGGIVTAIISFFMQAKKQTTQV